MMYSAGVIISLFIFSINTCNILFTEEGCLINKEELKPVTDLFPASGEYDHLTILREVLKSREWIVDQDSSLRQALELPLTLLCAR